MEKTEAVMWVTENLHLPSTVQSNNIFLDIGSMHNLIGQEFIPILKTCVEEVGQNMGEKLEEKLFNFSGLVYIISG